ncbi:YTH domain-containing protein 1-like [Diorhabda carinulata]|uniref:YTH domain-containing protein 1-like n=1 Tax=Diorhabda carinulata TaxID=1163345 RepID=UPI0025A02ABC|nr:YTH domain-containing protein 1-like [Diorhabda carinulata]
MDNEDIKAIANCHPNPLTAPVQNLNLRPELPLPTSYVPWKSDDLLALFDANNIFLLIKPTQTSSIEIAFQTGQWVFAPHTEKKILYFIAFHKTVYLLFTANNSQAFQGVAKFLHLYIRFNAKPQGKIAWIYKNEIPYTQLMHIRNPFNSNKLIFEGNDGQVVQEESANELFRILSQQRNVIYNSIYS